MGEITKILSLVPSLIEEDVNRALEAEVNIDEILNVLKSFKRGKVQAQMVSLYNFS